MINDYLSIIITFFTTTIASFITWLLSKRKYKAEVDSNVLDNIQKQLDIYKNIVTDVKAQLQDYIKESDNLREQVMLLQKQVAYLLPLACKIEECKTRKPFSKEDLIHLTSNNYEKASKETEGKNQ